MIKGTDPVNTEESSWTNWPMTGLTEKLPQVSVFSSSVKETRFATGADIKLLGGQGGGGVLQLREL